MIFVVVVCLVLKVLFSLVSAAFLANKDVYIDIVTLCLTYSVHVTQCFDIHSIIYCRI